MKLGGKMLPWLLILLHFDLPPFNLKLLIINQKFTFCTMMKDFTLEVIFMKKIKTVLQLNW